MNTQTQTTDAEILDVADDFRSQYKHGGTTFDEFNALGFARAVLVKWGTPAGAGRLEVTQADSVLEDAAQESEYRRGYRHGYEQRDAEVRGALA